MDISHVVTASHMMGSGFRESVTFKVSGKEVDKRERSSLMSAHLLSVRGCTGQQKSWEGKVQYLIKGTVILSVSSGWAK